MAKQLNKGNIMSNIYGEYGSKINGSRFTTASKGFKILCYLFSNGPKTKYECVTEVLGKVGSKQKLRGYYCVYFASLRDSGFVNYNPSNFTYSITDKGMKVIFNVQRRG